MLPMELAPKWLQDLARLNPFSYAVNASRELFAGNFGNRDSDGVWDHYLVCGSDVLVVDEEPWEDGGVNAPQVPLKALSQYNNSLNEFNYGKNRV